MSGVKTLGERAMDFLIEHEEEFSEDNANGERGFCALCGYDMLGGSPHAVDCVLGVLIVEINRERARVARTWPEGVLKTTFTKAPQDAALEAVSEGGSTADAPPEVELDP